jgi:anti-sigma regulatory factor (Ser/Thr protein kinase)/anti-anti-sigma regulatory factor
MPSTLKHIAAIPVPAELGSRAEDQFEERLRATLETNPPTVLLDCVALQLVTSRHIELLWRTRLRCQRSATKVRLQNPTSGLVRVLTVLDLAELFDCLPSPADGFSGEPTSAFDPADASYQDKFPPIPGEIVSASERFNAFLAGLPVPEMTRFELRTIFYEIASNIRQHGGMDDGTPVAFWAEFGSGRIIMTFADTGREYDPTAAEVDFDASTAAKKRRVRGFGIPMVRRMADTMSYIRSADGRNILTIVKTWSL